MKKEESSVSEGNALQILFYPISLFNSRINGIGVGDCIPSQSYVVPIADFCLLKFFTPDIFFFQIESNELSFQRNNKRTRCNVFAYIDSEFESYANLDSENRFCEYEDKYTRKPNPLKHIALKSKQMSDREKKCAHLAIDFGFPLINLVNFPKRKILKLRHEILEKWEEIIKSQRGSLEKDFVRTLWKGTRAIADEYSNLFIELAGISGENPFPASEPLYSFVGAFPKISLLSHISPPKILFNRVSMKAIFNLEKECATKCSEELSLAFRNLGYRTDVGHNILTKSKIKDKYRIEFQMNLIFPEFVDLPDIKWKLGEIRNIILTKVGNIDSEAREVFFKGSLEIWLKEIEIYIIIHKSFKEETVSLLRENLKRSLDYGSIMALPISKDLTRISFTLSFDRITDYALSEIDTLNVMTDRYTRLAVEELYKGKFSQALRYLEMGKNGLLGDFHLIKSREIPELSAELLGKANHYYGKARMDDSNISKGYFDNQFKEKILKALEVNSDWIVSLRLFLEAKKVERKDPENMMWWDPLYKKYSGLNVGKNLNDFLEEIGNFYSISKNSKLNRCSRK